jgi:zinc protease
MNCVRLNRQVALAVAATCFLAQFAGPAQAAKSKTAYQKVTTVEGITEYRLANGLRFLLFPDQSTPNVTINLVVQVGSRHEGYGETGMAHLLEHMLFKGTPTHKDIPRLLKDRGAGRNATTSYDRTNYFETMAGTDDNLEFGIRLEADRFVNSLIRREDLVQEMVVVRSEFEQGENSPDYILRQRMMGVAYEWHNYGKTVIGNRSDIERVPIERLQAFYHKYYRPDNAVLVVAGKFKPAKALAFITKYFGPLKCPKTKLDKTYTDEPAQDGERSVVLRRVGKVGLVGLMYHIPALTHPDSAALQVLADVLDTPPSGRLYKALVETKKATQVNAFSMGMHDPGIFAVNVQVTDPKQIREVRDQLIRLLEDAGKGDFTTKEVERIKRQHKETYERAMTRSNQMAMILTSSIASGNWRLFFLNRDRIAKVTPADVKRVAAKYLLRSNRTAGVYIPSKVPQRATIPESPPALDVVKDYKGKDTQVAQGEKFDPTPAGIEKRVKRSRLGKGVKVALLPKKTRGEMAVLNLTLRYGNEKTLTGKTMAGAFLGELMRRGTKKHDRQELQDELDKLGAQVGVFGGAGRLSVSLRVKKKNLLPALRLVGEILREPTFPAKDFDILKRRNIAGLSKGLTEPGVLASRALQRRLRPYPPDNIRYTPTLQESIARLKALTRDQVVQLYKEQLGGQVGELVLVGDFDAPPVLKLCEQFLGDWKSPVRYQRIAQPAKTGVTGGRDEILTPDKENAFILGGMMLALKHSHPDYPALKIGNYIFGGDTLSSRLGDRVRKKEGSYGVASRFEADTLDKAATFMVFAICNPKNMDKVDKAISEELNRFLKKGVSEKELEAAKKGYLRNQKRRWGSEGALARLLGTGLHEGWTFQYYAGLEKKINALTTEDVLKAFHKHIRPKRLVIIRAGDFKKK